MGNACCSRALKDLEGPIIPQNSVKPISDVVLSSSSQSSNSEQPRSKRSNLVHRLSSIISFSLETNSEDEDAGVDRERLRQIFEEAGVPVEVKVFDAVFLLFDINGDGKVNRKEFVTVMAFILEENEETSDRYAMAFELFDSTHSGYITRSEFNNMYALLFGTELKYLLRMPQGVCALEQYLIKEHSAESIWFWQQSKICKLKAVPWPSQALEDQLGATTQNSEGKLETHDLCLPLESVAEIVNRYIKEDAPEQVNVAADMREAVLAQVEKASAVCSSQPDEFSRQGWISATVFDRVEKEIVKLVEQDSFHRFKREVKSNPDFYDFSERYWEEFSIGELGMSQKQFEHWAFKYPDSFCFLDDLHKSLSHIRGLHPEVARKSISLFYSDGRNLLSHAQVERISLLVGDLKSNKPILRATFVECLEHVKKVRFDAPNLPLEDLEELFKILSHNQGTCPLVRFIVSWALVTNSGTRLQSRQLLFRIFDHDCKKVLDEETVSFMVTMLVDLQDLGTVFALQECVSALRVRKSIGPVEGMVEVQERMSAALMPCKIDDLALMEHLEELDHFARFANSSHLVLSLRRSARFERFSLPQVEEGTKQDAQGIMKVFQDEFVPIEQIRERLQTTASHVRERINLDVLQMVEEEIIREAQWPGLTPFLWEVVDKKCRERVKIPEKEEHAKSPRNLYQAEYMMWIGGRFDRLVPGVVIEKIAGFRDKGSQQSHVRKPTPVH